MRTSFLNRSFPTRVRTDLAIRVGALAAILLNAGIASAQDVASTQTSGTPIGELVVVGSRVATDVPPENGALPVYVIDSEALERSGAPTVEEFLRTLPALSGLKSGEGNGVSGGAEKYATLNLRGLGEQYTLVLLNGRRFSSNGPANYTTIPVSAVERIEVLRAGSGAVYGSDAVAGVVNIVTKRSGQGASVSASYGNVFDGDAPISEINASLAGGSETSNFFFSFSHYNRDSLLALDRDPTRTNDFTRFGSFDVRSSANNPGRIASFQPGQPAFIVLNTDVVGPGQTPTSPADFRAYDFNRDAHDRPTSGVTAVGDLERSAAYLGASTTLGDSSVQVLFDGLYATERAFLSEGSPVIDLASLGGVPATNPYNVFGVDVTSQFRWRPLDVGGPRPSEMGTTGERRIVNRDTARVSLGFQAPLAERLELDGAVGFFSLDQDVETPNSISLEGLTAALNRTDSTALNPFGNLANTPEQYAGVLVTGEQKQTFRSPSANLGLSGDLFSMPAGAMRFATGLEYRREEAAVTLDPLTARGDLADTIALAPFDLDRTIKAAYLELQVPLIKGASSGAPALELGAAVRYEDYSDFGSATKPLASVRWNVLPSLTLRGSYSESFRAPYLQEVAPLQTISTGVIVDPEAGNAVIDAQFVTGGNPDLTAEDAETYSVGVVFHPESVPNLRLSLDYFHIEQTGVVVAPSPQDVVNGTVPGRVDRGPGIGVGGEDVIVYALLTNIAGRKVQTFDLDASYAMALGQSATLDLRLNTTYLLKLEADSADGNGFVDYTGRYSSLFGGLPELRAILGATLTMGAFSAGAMLDYVDSYEDDPTFLASATSRTIPAYFRTDLTAAYTFGASGGAGDWLRGLEINAGVKNVFGEDAPFVLGNFSYDPGVADIYGRFYFAGATFKF